MPATTTFGPAQVEDLRVAGITGALDRRRSRPGGALYASLRWAGAGLFVAVVVALVVTIATQSSQAFAHSGIGFLWSGTWDPASNRYGAGILIVGTAITTLMAMVIVVPIGIGFAIFLSEQGPRWLTAPLSSAIDVLAAAPSIVIGLWALLILTPVFGGHVEPFLRGLPVLGHLFNGTAYGSGILLASVVLAVMALPTVVTLSRTALRGVPVVDREAAMALGATRWQVTRRAVLPAARSGISAAVTLATGRALGESIAVAMVIGNRPAIPHSLLAPGATLGTAIVNQFSEATPGIGTSSIVALGAVLLILTVLVNLGGQAFLRRTGGQSTGRGNRQNVLPPGPPVGAPGTDPGEDVRDEVSERRLQNLVRGRARATLRRRRMTGGLMQVLCLAAVVAGVAPLVALIYFTVARGARVLSVAFLTHGPTPPGVPGGGISTAIIGSAKIAGLALLMAVPVGLFTALFLHEHRGRVADLIRFAAETMTGVPSIIVGIFAYGLLVLPLHHFSNVAAAFAIAVLMLPVMIRANEEAMRTVPVDLWEAGMALGARRGRVTRSVVLRQALPGILTGNLLALARGLGETAPLLLTAAAPTLALTLLIYSDGTQAFAAAQQTAWGTAFVLLAAVLVISIVTRATAWALTRNTR
jgi:phosphate transport system permease protein